eukprot:1569631-Pyramimonas_sp.AAC.1
MMAARMQAYYERHGIPFWDEGLAGKALSAGPTSPRLDTTSLRLVASPPCNSGFPHAVWHLHVFREVSGVCDEGNSRSWLCVSVR